MLRFRGGDRERSSSTEGDSYEMYIVSHIVMSHRNLAALIRQRIARAGGAKWWCVEGVLLGGSGLTTRAWCR